MKKLLLIVLFTFSLQIFGQGYEVTKGKNVTLSAEQIEMENKKIEEKIKDYINRGFKEYLSTFSEAENAMKNQKNNKSEDIYLYKTFLEAYSQMFNLMTENTEIEVKSIKYLSNSKAIVKCEIKIPSFDKLGDLSEEEIEKNLAEKYNADKLKNMNEKEMAAEFLIYMTDLMKKELKENSSYEITKKSITFEKKGNDWKSKEYEEMFK